MSKIKIEMRKLNSWGVGFIFYYIVLIILYCFYYSRIKTNTVSQNNMTIVYIVAWIVFGLLVYFKAFLDLDIRRISYKSILYFSIVFNLLLMPFLPITSTDLLNYVSRGRIYSTYKENPYVVPFSSFSGDSYYTQLTTSWSNNTTIYGPFFTLLSSLVAFLGEKQIFVSIYIFKILFVTLNILTSFIIYLITKSKKSLFLYSWNPYLIFELSLNAHNDILMVFMMALSMLFLLTKKGRINEILGVVFLTLSFLIKPFTMILAPFCVVLLSFRYSSFIKKVTTIGWSLLVMLIITVFMYIPFWEGFVVFKRFYEVSNYTVLHSSPFVLVLYYVFNKIGIQDYYFWGRMVSKFVFLLIYALLLLKYFLETKTNEFKQFVGISLITTLAFFLISLNWFFPWYLIVLIFLVIIYFEEVRYKYYSYLLLGLSVFAASLLIIVR